MASNNGGPWGSGGGGNRGNGPSSDDKNSGGDRRPNGGNQPQIPEIDELLGKGNEYLKVLMGGKGGGNGTGAGPNGTGGPGKIPKAWIGLGALGAIGIWAFSSFYAVQTEQNGVELFLGQYHRTTTEGLQFAPWPFVTHELVNVTGQRSESIGAGSADNDGLMLTTDENIVDIDFQVVWNINDSSKYLFNLADPRGTVRAVSESSMREIIASRQLSPILNRDRGQISDNAKELIQSTLDDLDAGISIVRVNLDKADPPVEVINAFRDVQAAEQERDRLERQADAYANTVVAGARGTSASILEQAEGYRARVVNEAQGEASRFTAVLGEYQLAPEVTRKRLYLETIEEVYSGVDKIILDEDSEGSGIVPYLPLNELKKNGGAN